MNHLLTRFPAHAKLEYAYDSDVNLIADKLRDEFTQLVGVAEELHGVLHYVSEGYRRHIEPETLDMARQALSKYKKLMGDEC